MTWTAPNGATALASSIENGTQWSYRITNKKFNIIEQAMAYLNTNNGGYFLESSTTNPAGA